MLLSCGDFLEPESQSEYVPKLIKSLDELLLGEAYMGPGASDGALYGVLGLFDDDVAMRPDWNYDPADGDNANKLLLAFSWSKDMRTQFSGYNTYGEVYKKILGCNAVMDYMDDVQGTEREKNKVAAQALALRGFYYLHLVNLYGKPYGADENALGVPLKLDSEMGASGMPRNTVGEVYARIVKDLTDAEAMFEALPAGERDLGTNRINLPCVRLLLSRAYLYMEEWEQALVYGGKVISEPAYAIRDLGMLPIPDPWGNPSYPNHFTYANPEVIFLFGNQGDVLGLPMTMIYSSDGKGSYSSVFPAVASEGLIDAYDNNDLRKEHYLMWERINYGDTPVYKKATSKFQAHEFYNMNIGWNNGTWGTAFKVTEAYLNAAEAAAMLYKEGGKAEHLARAHELMDKLRAKRFAPGVFVPVSITDAQELVDFVRDERRRELCFENHRWFDLRRYGMEEIRHVWHDGSGVPTEYVLEKNDPGFTLQIPQQAFDHNSQMVQNEPRK